VTYNLSRPTTHPQEGPMGQMKEFAGIEDVNREWQT
jgi:hypothetical protein